MDFRRRTSEHPPIIVNWTPVERVSSIKFLSVNITEDLTWTIHTRSVVRKAHQHLFFLRRLKKFGLSSKILRQFYSCTVESILTGCITAWYGNCTALNRKAMHRIVQKAQHIVGGELPSLQDIYTQRCVRKARKIIRDSCHPSHELFSLLPSGRRYHSIRTRTSRMRDSSFSQAIRLLNSRQQTTLTNPPTPHTGFHLHTSHTDSDSTVACLALHSIEHMQLHLLFCTNNTVKH